MMHRLLFLATVALPLVACLPLDGAGSGSSGDGGAANKAAALLPGKWGALLKDGSADPSSGYYFASDGSWGHFEAGACTAGDSYVVQGDILTLRAGSTLIDYQVDFAGSDQQIRLRTPGTMVGDAASSAPSYVFAALDKDPQHSCASL